MEALGLSLRVSSEKDQLRDCESYRWDINEGQWEGRFQCRVRIGRG